MTRNENIIVVAMEECAELTQALSKALRFGMDAHHCETGIVNSDTVLYEYTQLQAVMEMISEEYGLKLDDKIKQSIMSSKKSNVEKFYQMTGGIS